MTTPKLRPSEEPEDSAFFSAFGASAFGASAFLEPKDGSDGALKDGKDGALKDGMDGADGDAKDFAGFTGFEFALACCAAKSSAATSDEAATWVTSTAAFAIGVAAIVSASTVAHACSLELARATPEVRRASPRAARATAVVFVVETRAIILQCPWDVRSSETSAGVRWRARASESASVCSIDAYVDGARDERAELQHARGRG